MYSVTSLAKSLIMSEYPFNFNKGPALKTILVGFIIGCGV